MRLAVVACALLLGGTGCGRCEGAVRGLKVDPPFEGSLSFTVWGDGPGSVTSDELRELSGIDETTFFVEGPDGLLDEEVVGDWGGHSCLNGVNFGIYAEQVPPGEYEATLRIEALAWPFRGDKDQLQQRDGEQVLTVQVTVPEAE